jgi:hypothetical protein
MFKPQLKFTVIKMSQYSASQHSTQTTIKPIAYEQNRINFLQQNSDLNIYGKNVRSAVSAVRKKVTINLPERTYGKDNFKMIILIYNNSLENGLIFSI